MHKNVIRTCAALGFLVPLVCYATVLHAAPSFNEGGSSMVSLATVVERVTPGVVGISVGQGVGERNPLLQDPAFRRFFEEAFKGKVTHPGGAPAVLVRPALTDALNQAGIKTLSILRGESKLRLSLG